MMGLKVGINAQFIPGGELGGVEQFIMGLVHGLGQLADGPEEYTIVGPWQEPDWLRPYMGRNQRLESGPRSQLGSREWVSWLRFEYQTFTWTMSTRRFVLARERRID